MFKKLRRFLAIKRCRFMLWRRRHKRLSICDQCGKPAEIKIAFVGGQSNHFCSECKENVFEWHRKNGKEPQIILQVC